jgi:hypothetical protein
MTIRRDQARPALGLSLLKSLLGGSMEYDEEKLDEMVLALLYLTSFAEHGITRAWKGHDWDVLNRLHEKALISDPKNKNKSVGLSEDAAQESAKLFWKYFGKPA